MQYMWMDGDPRHFDKVPGIDGVILPLNHGIFPLHVTTRSPLKFLEETGRWATRQILMGWPESRAVPQYVAQLSKAYRLIRDAGLPLPDCQHDAEEQWRGYRGELALLERLISRDPLLSSVRHSVTTVAKVPRIRRQDKAFVEADFIDEDFVQAYSGYGRGWDTARLLRPGNFQEYAHEQRKFHGKNVVMGIALNHQDYPEPEFDFEKGVRISVLTAYRLGHEDVAFWSRKHSKRYVNTLLAFDTQRKNPHLVLDGILGPRTRDAL